MSGRLSCFGVFWGSSVPCGGLLACFWAVPCLAVLNGLDGRVARCFRVSATVYVCAG